MVQKQTRWRSSLVMGVLLALLLGIAAGFFVLAMPIRMLETVTTFTRLARLMVQAEPPISPNDRTLLAVLAGILTAGGGWVLVDWLVFGRAGMRRLIRTRDDDYEDDDDADAFRPTDPLDLVTPIPLAADDWNQGPSGDARRPLSARTDIGDPPRPAVPYGDLSASAPRIDQALPPIDQILPGIGATPQPFQPMVPPPLFPQAPASGAAPQLPQPQPAPEIWRAQGVMPADGQSRASWPPLDTPGPAAPAQQPSSAPSWLPPPGIRPEIAQSDMDAEPPPAAPVAADSQPALADRVPLALPTQQAPPLLNPAPPFAPPPMAPTFPTPPEAIMPPAPQPAAPPAMVFEPAPAPAPAPIAPRVSAPRVSAGASRRPPQPGFDKARLEDLLARLERGLQNRRAAAVHAMPAPSVAPMPVEPPAAYAARRPVAPPPEAVYYPPPTQQPAPYEPPPPPTQLSPVMPGPQVVKGGKDEMLDQPLHVTLDLLRNMVKR